MRKTQSAMEYLMTYGWAILAIAIVMVSLYSLGIFNTGSLQPTASPGSCEVVRTSAQTSLAGQCSNLIPRYVMHAQGTASFTMPDVITATTSGAFTVSMWVYFSKMPMTIMGIASKENYNVNGFRFGIYNNTGSYKIQFWTTESGGTMTLYTPYEIRTGQWYYVTVTYNNQNGTIYLNGTQTLSGTGTYIGNTHSLVLGYIGGWSDLQGDIANVQVYNSSLDNATVKALYLEGIGGAPIDVSHIVAWWPLNGNVNDYSGNNHNVQQFASGMNWNANWQAGYTSPTS